jgi:putative ABC transport system permease protein
MRLSLSDEDAEAVIGDFVEDHAAIAARSGPRAARRWFWRQTMASTFPNAVRRLRCGMEAFLRDLAYGWRMIRRRPAMTTVALLSLVIGITLPATVFSLLNAVVFRPLPLERPDELVVVHEIRATGINHNLPYPDFVDYRKAQRDLTDLAAYSMRDVTIRLGTESRVVAAELVSGGFFSTLGVPMHAGRGIADIDDRPGGESVVVVSEGLWRELNGSEVTGFAPQPITLNAQDFTIVGVAAAPFRGMQVGRDARLWLPLHTQPLISGAGATNLITRRTASWLTLIGRLRPGATRESAALDLNRVETVLAPQVGRQRPKSLTLAPGRLGDSDLPRSASSGLLLLLGAGVLVLLVAAANVASLLLARASERIREMAVRTALGARRTRLASLMFSETLILGLVGASLALVGSRWAASLVVPLMARFGDTVVLDTSIDGRVLAFVAALAATITALTTIAPARGALRALTAGALADGGRAVSEGKRVGRVRGGLVISQFALSLSLVVASVLCARTVYNLRALPTGFDVDHIALLTLEPSAAQYDVARSRSYMTAVQQRVSALPGIRAADFGRIVPLGFGGARTTVIVPGYQPAADEDMELNFNVTAPGYLDAMGIRLREGRFFNAYDVRERPSVIVVNQTMAARYWRGRSPLGARVRFSEEGPDIEVVGVAEDVKYRMLREDARPSFYVPYAQSAALDGVLHVRTWGEPAAAISSVRQALSEVDANVPVITVRTLQEQAALNVNDERVALFIALTLAAAALLLAAVGLYGSMSYAVRRRTRELGVRLALGATVADIRRLVLAHGLRLCVAGTVIGSFAAIATARLIEHRLFGVKANDPATLIASAVILSIVAVMACWIPARRATRVDPANALRTE